MLYTFENNFGERRIISGNINWRDDFKWTLGKNRKKKPRNIEMGMPLGEMCTVNSSVYDMRGFWKLIEIN
tara:strand:- start:430 stop:639 length:210 start_codon:yes stop_codon:yes gene_type:complete